MNNIEIKLNKYNYYMKKFLRLFISTLLFFNSIYYTKVALADKNKEISIDYQKKTTASNDYIIDAEDELYISLSRKNPDFNNRHTVNRDGKIYLPRLKRTYVDLKGKVKFVRYNSDGSIDKRIFKFKKNENPGNYKNPYLNYGEIIMIGQSKYNAANEFISEITSPFLGIFTNYSILKDIL